MKKYNFPISVRKNFASSAMRVLCTVLPCFRGCWIMYAPLFNMIPRDKRLVEVVILSEGHTLFTVWFDVRNPPEFIMVKKTRFDLGTAAAIWSLLSEGDTFFDVGANFGLFTQVGSQKVGTSGAVVAIEPGPEAFSFLDTVKLSNVQKINKVASTVSGDRFTIDKPFYRQTTGSRFLPDPAGRLESVSLNDVYQSLGRPNVSCIKIDTEGAELFVLQGADLVLEERHPFVISEIFGHAKHFAYAHATIYEYLERFGYRHFYSISDDGVSISKLDNPEDGQILFSTRELHEADFTLGRKEA